MQNHDSQYDPSVCIHFRELMTGVSLCFLKERSDGNPDCSSTRGQIRKKPLELQRAQGAMCPRVILIVLTFNPVFARICRRRIFNCQLQATELGFIVKTINFLTRESNDLAYGWLNCSQNMHFPVLYVCVTVRSFHKISVAMYNRRFVMA